MQTVVETITPTMAENYLKLNTGNRPIRTGLVKFLREEIADGRWAMNGEPIIFSSDRLLDGQHRLLAIKASGKSVRSLVVRGVKNQDFSTIDMGTPRRPADVLTMKGEKSAFFLAPACAWVLRYKDGVLLTHKRTSSTRIEQFLESNGRIRQSLELCRGVKLVPVPVSTAAHFLFHKKDDTLADLFIDGLRNGFKNDDRDPFFAFRERMIENQTSTSKLHAIYIFALMVKAWNLARGHDKLAAPLVFKPYGRKAEGFPEIR